MRANFALKSGRDEWTRTTDPHLIRKSLFKCGWNTYYLLTFVYENFSTTKFLFATKQAQFTVAVCCKYAYF